MALEFIAAELIAGQAAQRRPAQDYQRLLASNPARRLNPAQLAERNVLKNKLVDLPQPVAQRKLLPMLASAPLSLLNAACWLFTWLALVRGLLLLDSVQVT